VLKRQVCISADNLVAASIRKDSIELEQGVVRRYEQVGIEPNRTGRVKRVGGSNSTDLKIDLLKLNANRRRR
jgi:hypothetical protein